MKNIQNQIPNVKFESKTSLTQEIEIITLKSLKKRTLNLNHSPEKAHQVTFNLLVYYTKGTSKHLVDFEWYDVHKDTVIHLNKGQINAFQFNENLEGFLILFTDDYLKRQLNKLPSNEVVRMFNKKLFSPKIQIPKNSNVKNYINLFFDEYYKDSNTYNKKKICDNLYTIIFSKLEELKQFQTLHIKQSDKLELFLRFKNLVESNYFKNRNANYYASKLHITYKHLNNICKEVIETTAKSFIDEFVILEAKRMLVNSSITSNQLAIKLGFNEPTNFIKYFKKNTGLTPNSFKKRYK